MNLHEHQTKSRFAEFGIPVPMGRVAHTPEEVEQIARELGGTVVVKSQVLAGGRGLAGGVKVKSTPEEAKEFAAEILGKLQIKGLTVHKVLVDPAANIAQEIYLGIVNDRQSGKPVLISSEKGGMDIEEVARTDPDAIIREYIDPVIGLHPYQTNNIASGINLPRDLWGAFSDIAQKLWQCYLASDATLAEINPLVITKENTLVALDGKMSIDDNALGRQKELAKLRDTTAEPEAETKAREAGIAYVKLNGQIGCMVNGAGLAMATMDMVKLYGDEFGIGPANFLDIGGGAQADRVAAALRIILSDPNVKAVLFNIFGGITRGDEVARGLIAAYNEIKPTVPMIIRLVGTNAKEGLEIVNNAGIPNLTGAATLTEAAQKAVEAAKGA